RVLGALVTMAQRREHPELASALLWLGLWPGLDAIYRRRLRFFIGEPDELAADLTGAFTELVARLDLGSVRRVAATLVLSTERDLMTRRKRIWAREARELPAEPCDAHRAFDEEPPRASRLDAVALDRWAASGDIASGRSFDEEAPSLRAWLGPIVG